MQNFIQYAAYLFIWFQYYKTLHPFLRCFQSLAPLLSSRDRWLTKVGSVSGALRRLIIIRIITLIITTDNNSLPPAQPCGTYFHQTIFSPIVSLNSCFKASSSKTKLSFAGLKGKLQKCVAVPKPQVRFFESSIVIIMLWKNRSLYTSGIKHSMLIRSSFTHAVLFHPSP